MYSDLAHATPMWSQIEGSTGDLYDWDTTSTYIQEPPFFTQLLAGSQGNR
jgi:aconitase (EC 4.2.1.3)